MPLPEFTLQQLVKEHGLTLDGKNRIITELQPLLKAASSGIQRSLILSHFSEAIGISAEELGSSMAEVKPSPPTIESQPARFPEELTPLSSSQKRLVTHMVLYPGALPELKEAGLRTCLSGTIGEVLLLQLLALLERGGNIEPEELLDKLPPGGERVLVSNILLSSSSDSASLCCQGTKGELREILSWLERESLLKLSKKLIAQISTCALQNTPEDLQQLVAKKIDVDKRLQDIRRKNAMYEPVD